MNPREKKRMIARAEKADSNREASPLCPDGGCLHDDLLTDILLRLPVKSLTRFQCVCKSWLRLISSDHFRRHHTLRRHTPPPSLLISALHSQIDYFNQPTLSPKITLYYSDPTTKRSEKQGRRRRTTATFDTNILNYFQIKNCSKGLMLLRRMDGSGYHVYNPTTRQSKPLSLPWDDDFKMLRLVFDPSESPHYKVVSIWVRSGRFQLQVFSSETESWSVCVEEPFIHGVIISLMDMMNMTACVECKGFIFCHAYTGRIYCFDTAKNVSQVIVCPVPKLAEAIAFSSSIQGSNGCVYYYALLVDKARRASAALWELQVDGDDPRGSEWVLMYEDRVRALGDGLGFKVLTFVAGTRTLLIYNTGKIVAYNFLDKSCKVVVDFEVKTSLDNVHVFGETLAVL